LVILYSKLLYGRSEQVFKVGGFWLLVTQHLKQVQKTWKLHKHLILPC